jgi:hypothetical protein
VLAEVRHRHCLHRLEQFQKLINPKAALSNTHTAVFDRTNNSKLLQSPAPGNGRLRLGANPPEGGAIRIIGLIPFA